MNEKPHERADADVKCVADGKRMFLKLGATAPAALAFDLLTARFVAANDNRILDLPMLPQNGAEGSAVLLESSAVQEKPLTGFYERRVLDGTGHFVQRENPAAFVAAVKK